MYAKPLLPEPWEYDDPGPLCQDSVFEPQVPPGAQSVTPLPLRPLRPGWNVDPCAPAFVSPVRSQGDGVLVWSPGVLPDVRRSSDGSRPPSSPAFPTARRPSVGRWSTPSGPAVPPSPLIRPVGLGAVRRDVRRPEAGGVSATPVATDSYPAPYHLLDPGPGSLSEDPLLLLRSILTFLPPPPLPVPTVPPGPGKEVCEGGDRV